jgi:SAM-dependent methyltransferase
MSLVSFRDPAGFCVVQKNRVIRGVSVADQPVAEEFLGSTAGKRLVEQGRLVSSRQQSAVDIQVLRTDPELARLLDRPLGGVYEHPRIVFPSFAHEWPPEMLQAAGELTLDLAEMALEVDFGLKDATPSNVLFDGPNPVFIDLLSFEKRTPGDPVWLPAAQFSRTFLLPLLAAKHWGLTPAEIFLANRDGMEPERLYRLCGPLRRFLPPFLNLVSLPTWLGGGKSKGIYKPHLLDDPEKARFILESLLGRLRRSLRSVSPPADARSTWSGYTEGNSYNDSTLKAKEDFVRDALRECGCRRVLDIGANTGQYSFLAAEAGASVVAVDYDVACAGRIWRQARECKLSVLPLVVNLSRPTPAAGWCNRECPSFLDRARGAFDGVLMLAVIHHLAVTERVPLAEVLDLAADLTRDMLVVEFVGPKDAMFQTLARGRDHLYADVNQAAFESAAQTRFTIVRTLPLAGLDRTLYFLRRKP